MVRLEAEIEEDAAKRAPPGFAKTQDGEWSYTPVGAQTEARIGFSVRGNVYLASNWGNNMAITHISWPDLCTWVNWIRAQGLAPE